MNEKILDSVFTSTDTLLHLIETDETVIWEGRPNFNLFYWFIKVLLPIIYPLLYFLMIGASQFVTIFFVIVIIIYGFYKYLGEKQTRYLITNQRIIFKLPKSFEEKNIYALQFDKIRNSRIELNNTICFILKKSKYHWPMEKLKLESISDFEEVEKYIQLGLRGKL